MASKIASYLLLLAALGRHSIAAEQGEMEDDDIEGGAVKAFQDSAAAAAAKRFLAQTGVSAAATSAPTPTPTEAPTQGPTSSPSAAPTLSPTAAPTTPASTPILSSTTTTTTSASMVTYPAAPPANQSACKQQTIDVLDSRGTPWRHGGWAYAGLGAIYAWPGGAVTCEDACNTHPRCYHWVFHCRSLNCYLFGHGGYEQDGDSQFGRDYQFLGDADRFSATVTTTTTATAR